MSGHIGRLAAVVGLGLAAMALPAQAVTLLFSDDFNDPNGATDGTYALNTAPAGWAVVDGTGTVDWIEHGTYGLSCVDGAGGCVDLDGSTNNAGVMTTNGTFDLQQGITYVLRAMVSGNQRAVLHPDLAGPDTLTFGFFDGSGAITSPYNLTTTVSNIASGMAYTYYQLVVTPTVDYDDVRIFFSAADGDNVGPMLDNVSLTAVPLPAAGWLLLSGLVGLVAVRRRGAAV